MNSPPIPSPDTRPPWLRYVVARTHGASMADAARAAGSLAKHRGTLHRWARAMETHEIVRVVIEGAKTRASAAADAYLAAVLAAYTARKPIPR